MFEARLQWTARQFDQLLQAVPRCGLGLVVPILLAFGSLPAWAEPGWHGMAVATTDYIARGYTKSNGQPTVQGNLEYLDQTGLYAGGWLSRVVFDKARIEAIPYVGWRTALSDDWDLDLTGSGYVYNRRLYGRRPDYVEAYGALHYRDRASFGVAVAPDAYGLGKVVADLQGQLRQPIGDMFEISALLGFERAQEAYAYDNLYWNLGLTWFPTRHLALDLRYYDLRELNYRPFDVPAGGDPSDYAIDSRAVFQITWAF